MPTPVSARLRAAALLLPLALGACAGAAGAVQNATRAPDRAGLLLTDHPAPRDGCRINPSPSHLPTLGALADSAALHAAAERFARANPVGPGRQAFLVLSVGWDAAGQVERVQGIDWFLPQGTAPALEGAVRQHLRSQRGRADLRIRVNFDQAAPRFLVGRSEVCPPALRVRVELQRSAWSNTGSTPQPVRARVLVGTDGRARGVTLVRPTGQTEIDRFVESMLQRATYAPGLVDGQEQVMDFEVTVPFVSR